MKTRREKDRESGGKREFRNVCATILALSALVVVLSGCVRVWGVAAEVRLPPESGKAAESAPQLRHVVLFGFKPETPAGLRARIEEAACNLPKAIDLIRDFEWGIDVNDPTRAPGYTHCMQFLFDTVEDKDAYLVHPAHEAFRQLALPHIEHLLVVDYPIRR